MSWNVLLTAGSLRNEAVDEAAKKILLDAGCELTEAFDAGMADVNDLRSKLPGVDAVLAGVEPYTAELLASDEAKELKVISRWGVGFDGIDLNAAADRGVLVTNTPNLLNDAVADLTFGLILALARRLHEGHCIMISGEWKASWGVDVGGATLGILGIGRIGKAVAKRAAGFGMKILACDPFPQPDAEALGVTMVELDELLSQSDFVTIHTALTDETRGLIGADALRKMKSDAMLINTSRGAVLDEDALVRALQKGTIGGAALDTYLKEPLAADHPLRSCPNVLLTPHQASFGVTTGKQVSRAAAQAIVDAMNGRRPASVVNQDVLRIKNRASIE
jgi:phosphoglycerate dehydrogenase-like enzyme